MTYQAQNDTLISEDGISATYTRFASHELVDEGLSAVPMVAGEYIRIGLKCYRLGSVVSYAMQYAECPIEALDRARSLGHALHWANPCATVLSAHKGQPRKAVALKMGDLIRFEGHVFELAPAPNHNIKLIQK